MQRVVISAATYDLAVSISLLGLAGQGVKQPDGTYVIELSDETMERLDGYRLEGETTDETIFRVLTLAITRVKGIMGAIN